MILAPSFLPSWRPALRWVLIGMACVALGPAQAHPPLQHHPQQEQNGAVTNVRIP